MLGEIIKKLKKPLTIKIMALVMAILLMLFGVEISSVPIAMVGVTLTMVTILLI